MYQALYRKWRPRTFDEVVGQEQVTETLKNQVSNDRTTHAYLFVGVRGTGKTTCAKLLARALNCESPVDGNPCNKCSSCVGIESGSVMDVVEIDAASNNGVDNVRALRDEAIYSPASVKKRVYIIDEVHMLSTAAFNALLKILEEPPEHLVFILATTEMHKVLPTILSRCQRYSFGRIAPDNIAHRLEYIAGQESIALEDDAAVLLARLADGSMRDGISLLDQCSGVEVVTTERVLSAMGLAGKLKISRLLDYISDKDTSAAIELFESLWREGKSPATLLSELSELLRDLLMLGVAPKSGRALLSGGYDDKTLTTLGKKLSPGAALEYISLLQASSGSLRDGRDPKIEAELCIIGMCEPELLDTPARLGLRIAKLEQALSGGLPAASVPLSSPDRHASAPHDSPPATPPPIPNSTASPVEKDENAECEISNSDIGVSDTDICAPSIDKEDIVISESDNDFDSTQEASPIKRTPAKADGDSIWPALYEALSLSMPPFHLSQLSGASARHSGGKLVISVKSAFAKSWLEKTEPMELIRKAVVAVTGDAMPIVIAESKAAPDDGKLKELSKFDNVKFE